jgi:hypothetical protein
VNTPHGPVPAPKVGASIDPPSTGQPDAAVAVAVAPKPAPVVVVLKGKARFVSSPVPRYELENRSGFLWTDCYAIFPGKKRGAFASLRDGTGTEFQEGRLEIEPGAAELTGKVLVRCKQGSGAIPLAP